MTDIKPVIENLTKFLALCGFIRIQPEIFRQAKFDKENACPFLWHLLAELLQFNSSSGQFNWDSSTKARECDGQIPQVDKNLIVFVKCTLIAEGYPSAFAFDSSADYGSRGLLVAIGWFLAKANLIDRLVELRLEKLSAKWENDLHQISPLTPTRNSSALEIINCSSHSNLDLHSTCQRLIWLIGKIKLTSRNLFNIRQEKWKLLTKVNVIPELNLLNHRSIPLILQLNVLKQPKVQGKFLKLLTEETNFFKTYLKWKEKEGLFWKWMATVLDNHNFQSKKLTVFQDESSLIVKLNRDQCDTLIKNYQDINLKVVRNRSAAYEIAHECHLINMKKINDISISKLCEELYLKQATLLSELKQKQQNAKEILNAIFGKLDDVIFARSIPPMAESI